MSSTISSKLTSTYVLSSAAQNPLTVSSSGTVAVHSTTAFTNAITGNSGVAWTIVNAGVVQSNGSYGVGINLASGGALTNEAGGYIEGSALGIQINGTTGNPALVTNYGLIKVVSGYLFGNAVAIGSLPGTVVNSGTIFGYNNAAGAANAIQLGAGGLVNNSGLIDGFSLGNNQGGVVSFAGVTTVINSGTIVAPGSNGNGINVQAGDITNSGLITGAGQGITVTSGVVNNSGTVAQAGGAGSQAVNLGAGSGSGTLVNSGTVIAAGSSGNAVLVGVGGGLVVNGQTPGGPGLISAYHTGIGFFPGPGTGPGILTIVNDGTIASTQLGALAGNAFTINTGGGSTATIDNSGTISSAETGGGGAILLAGGQITNSAGGVIAAAAGAAVTGNGTPLTVTNSGTIAGLGANGFGVLLPAGSTLTNAGTIAGQIGAVTFAGTSGNRLIVETGGTFTGAVSGGNGQLELAAGVGEMRGFGQSVTGFASLQFDTDANWTVRGYASGMPATITGFAGGDAIDLKNFLGVSETFASNRLIVTDTVGNHVTLGIQGSFTSADFRLSTDRLAGTLVTVLPATSTADDFNADGRSDILWRNSDGSLALWTMNGGTIAAAQAPTYQGATVAPDPSWSVAVTGDFTGDGKTDILWRNTNNSLELWTMNGATIMAGQALTYGGPVAPGSSWSVAASGDFTGDSKTDVLWRDADNTLVMWVMNGPTIISKPLPLLGPAAIRPDASWSVVGTGDFNGDGMADILWRDTNNALALWTMNSSTITAAQDVTFNGGAVMPDSSWSVAGIGDFTGDGNADVLWRNTSGALDLWAMNGSTITAAQDVTFQGSPVGLDASWTFDDVGDFTGDGTSDVVWRNTTGALAEWVMNGATITSASAALTFQGAPVTPDKNWQILT